MTALFRNNYLETIELLTETQRREIKNSTKDYVVLDVQITNIGAVIYAHCTSDYSDYEIPFLNGEVTILDREDFDNIVDNYETKTGKKFYSKEVA